MREIILREKVRASGRLFELGSLLMYGDQVPVHIGNDLKPDSLVGYGRDMKLDAMSGEVSMDLLFKPGYVWTKELNDMYTFTIYADQVEARGLASLNTQVITKCRLKAVIIVPIASMPVYKKDL